MALAKECTLSLLEALVLVAQFAAQSTYSQLAACGRFVRTLTVAELQTLLSQVVSALLFSSPQVSACT
jgi:hypothetical protein